MNIVLPADLWWLLRVPVKAGACTPFHLSDSDAASLAAGREDRAEDEREDALA